MENNNLLILGAGQYGMVTKEVAESMGVFGKIDFLDDKNPVAIGKMSDFSEQRLKDNYKYAIVAVGDSRFRVENIQKLMSDGYDVPWLRHEKAVVSKSAKIGRGCIIEANVTVNTDAVVKMGCIISAGATLNHNCVVNEGCHINCNSVVGSGVTVKAGTKSGYSNVLENDKSRQMVVVISGINVEGA